MVPHALRPPGDRKRERLEHPAPHRRSGECVGDIDGRGKRCLETSQALRGGATVTKLKELRNAKNLTQTKLADQAGVSLKALQAYEQDFRPLGRASAEDVYNIAKVLGTTIEELLDLEPLKKQ